MGKCLTAYQKGKFKADFGVTEFTTINMTEMVEEAYFITWTARPTVI